MENHWNKLQYIWSLILSYLIDFPLWPDKSVNTNFWQYQSDRDSGKFICCLEIQSKIAEIISVCILNLLRLSLTGFYLGLKLQFKFKLQWEKVCFKLNICKRDLKPKKVKPISNFFWHCGLKFKGCRSRAMSLESRNVFIAEKIYIDAV